MQVYYLALFIFSSYILVYSLPRFLCLLPYFSPYLALLLSRRFLFTSLSLLVNIFLVRPFSLSFSFLFCLSIFLICFSSVIAPNSFLWQSLITHRHYHGDDGNNYHTHILYNNDDDNNDKNVNINNNGVNSNTNSNYSGYTATSKDNNNNNNCNNNDIT